MDTWNGVPVIDDATPNDFVFDPNYARGGEPRDYGVQPMELFASADMIPLIPKSEWRARIEELDREEAQVDHVILRARAKGRFKDLNQNPFNFCWAHSVTHAVMASREIANLPPVALSAFGLVHLADPARAQGNRGGWCGLAAQAAREKGIPSQATYPQGKVKQSLNEAILEDAKKHLVTEDFVDLQKPVWFQNLSFEAVASCLLTGRPCAVDFNWWSHSVCAVKLVEVEAGSFGIVIDNSWGLAWGDQGRGILRGSRAIPDGAIAINTVRKAA